MKRRLTLAEMLHAVASIWIWLSMPDNDVSLVQVIKSSKALDELMEELRRALNQTQ